MDNTKNRFTTLFYEGIHNYHLAKDIAQLPNAMAQLGYKASLVTFNLDEQNPFINTECSHVKVQFLSKTDKVKRFSFEVVKFLMLNSRQIDILNLYHFKFLTFLYGLIYKLLNPKGVLYLKLDLDLPSLNHIVNKKSSLVSLITSPITFLFIKMVDLLTVENTIVFNKIGLLSPKLISKSYYLPNGFDIKKYSTAAISTSKKPIILSVGRHGSYQKNTELLLEAYALLPQHSFELVLIGTVEPHFEQYVEDYFKKYPFLQSKIKFLGQIEDRSLLFEHYQQSKIFCLTSRHESFGLVLLEALYFQNYLVTTPFESANDIITSTNIGKVALQNNAQSFSQALEYAIEKTENNSIDQTDRLALLQTFTWINVAKELSKMLNKIN
jgi:glycosyltransferase involved in cell wall biosynthesis